MNNPTQVCECGSNEFITKPNAYDIYKLVDGKVEFEKHEFIEDKFVLYCRNCSKELEEEIL